MKYKQYNTILYFGVSFGKRLLELPFIFNEVIKSKSKAQLIVFGKMYLILFRASTWKMMEELFTKEALLR
jgi:hypothetical protein